MTSKSRFMALLSAMVLFSATALVGCSGDKAADDGATAPAEAPAATDAAAPAADPAAAAPAAPAETPAAPQ